ncbi:hypothetical protein M419DRAFT_96014 [Trichoderma reesei RUT C-30]|uniref:Zn(2)-C6 fungal-type domain-containing protein n=1 Tax=Hypocrea jecorina (strain ATCC 56765 / BCRC 32924 / NRRL 11460 / Rut C-30) TaxID=1344414 RepID=A0A024SMF0_HYPJR|nr:hypothetical protein M419DRAFT_96014 [Trichoderma reesei RUT C-30]
MVPDDSGDDKSLVAVSNDATSRPPPRPASASASTSVSVSASPARDLSPKPQLTQVSASDPTSTVAAAAPPSQELKHEQQPPPQPQPQPHPSPKQQIPSPLPHNPPLPQQHPSPQQNGDSRVSESASNTATPKPETEPAPEPASDMASHRPALHGLHAGYATTSSSPIYTPQSSLPTTQYASYSTVSAQQGDAYRVSPVGTPQMSLPSMRTIDAMSQQSVPPMPHHSMSMSMSMPLTSVSPTPPYFTSHSTPLPSNYGFPQDALARYPLPHDPRLINHRGPKKCDETHPTCNNCRKSKRECLGYDPIFRQQAGTPTSSNVQPASSSLSPATEPSGLASSTAGPSTPRLVNSYGSQSPMLPSVYATGSAPSTPSIPPNSYIPPISTPGSSSAVSVKQEYGYGYSSNIDPAVRSMSGTHNHQMSLSGSDNGYLRAKKMRIDEIIDLLGPPAPAQQISHTEETFNEITKVYHEMYAGGLSAFFETSWYYFTENGKMTFPKDANLIEHMATFLKILEGVKANDHTQMAYSGVLETRIVWELACTAYQVPERATNSMRLNLPPDNDAIEARNRLHVVEALLCGDELLSNPLCPPVADGDHHRVRQFDFWYSLAEFVRRRENPNSPAAVKAREDVLARMRHLLDGRENRDVLYSIAVVRELAPNFDAGYAATIPQHLDESDPKNRLAVASKFLLDESQVTGGTTNVVRRFSDIASRAFVNPGVNIARRV